MHSFFDRAPCKIFSLESSVLPEPSGRVCFGISCIQLPHQGIHSHLLHETLELDHLKSCYALYIVGISVPPPPSLMSFPPPRYLTASTTLTASTNFHHQGRPRPPFGGRGPGRPSDTLIIRKIPRELNTITKLSSHFEKFGTVVNLTVSLYQPL